jgi:hypothetical protein
LRGRRAPGGRGWPCQPCPGGARHGPLAGVRLPVRRWPTWRLMSLRRMSLRRMSLRRMSLRRMASTVQAGCWRSRGGGPRGLRLHGRLRDVARRPGSCGLGEPGARRLRWRDRRLARLVRGSVPVPVAVPVAVAGGTTIDTLAGTPRPDPVRVGHDLAGQRVTIQGNSPCRFRALRPAPKRGGDFHRASGRSRCDHDRRATRWIMRPGTEPAHCHQSAVPLSRARL